MRGVWTIPKIPIRGEGCYTDHGNNVSLPGVTPPPCISTPSASWSPPTGGIARGSPWCSAPSCRLGPWWSSCILEGWVSRKRVHTQLGLTMLGTIQVNGVNHGPGDDLVIVGFHSTFVQPKCVSSWRDWLTVFILQSIHVIRRVNHSLSSPRF